MIPWSQSSWSLSDLLRALGLKHRESASFGCRDVLRGRAVVCTGNYDGVVAWLRAEGAVA